MVLFFSSYSGNVSRINGIPLWVIDTQTRDEGIPRADQQAFFFFFMRLKHCLKCALSVVIHQLPPLCRRSPGVAWHQKAAIMHCPSILPFIVALMPYISRVSLCLTCSSLSHISLTLPMLNTSCSFPRSYRVFVKSSGHRCFSRYPPSLISTVVGLLLENFSFRSSLCLSCCPKSSISALISGR